MINLLDQVEFFADGRTRTGYICGVIHSNPKEYEARYEYKDKPFRGPAECFRVVGKNDTMVAISFFKRSIDLMDAYLP